MTTEITQIIAALPAGDTVKSASIHAAAKALGFGWSKYGKTMMHVSRRRERGYYFIGDLRSGEVHPAAVFTKTVEAEVVKKPVFKLSTAESAMIAVPAKDPHFIPWGNFDLIEQVIGAGRFFPVFISGVSGNGKTLMVEQACARAKRQMVRVQITPETDEDSLIGGHRLLTKTNVTVKMNDSAMKLYRAWLSSRR